MADFDAKALNQGWTAEAVRLERRMRDLRQKLAVSSGYQTEYDHSMAEYSVYNYISDRTFSQDRDSLCAEVRQLLAEQAPDPDDSYITSLVRFQERYKAVLERLLSTYCGE